MTDLQKMREDFEKKYAREEKANVLELRFGTEFYVFDRFNKPGLRIVAKSCNFPYETISKETARKLLNAFPADEKLLLNSSASGPKDPIHGFYLVRAERGFRDSFTSLKVSWMNEGDEYEFLLHIDGDAVLEPFFDNSTRKMDSSELETYKPTYRGHIRREMDLPIKRFKCKHLSYKGGYLSCLDLDVIDQIIKSI